ncbi:MAG: hypothetical protein HFI38_07290 [Lachnospiraceae bacterium]|nr:hypothetical protein [Lachnospiraceae bacterium]
MENRSKQIVFSLSQKEKEKIEQVQKGRYPDMSEKEVVKELVKLGLRFLEVDPDLCKKLVE